MITEQPMPDGFRLKDGLIYAESLVGRGSSVKETEIAISSQINVIAEVCNQDGVFLGRLLEWHNSAGSLVQWVMPICVISSTNTNGLLTTLLDLGLTYINFAHKRKLSTYLMACKPNSRIIIRHTNITNQTVGGMGMRVWLKGFRFPSDNNSFPL